MDQEYIRIEGADLMNGTPILDIKPYLPFTDSHPDATSGWTSEVTTPQLEVIIPLEVRQRYNFTSQQWQALEGVLASDPRPHYQDDPERIYSFEFRGENIKFSVSEGIAKMV